MYHFRVVVAMLAVVALSGCATPVTYAVAPAPPANEPYRLGSGDRLRVVVFGQDNLSNSYSVDSAGFISMPLIGRVRATGATTPELEKTIEARLRQGFLREPSVSVEVEAYRPFFVLGEVADAGQYPYFNGVTVQKAVAVAGGFAPWAVESGVEITRDVDGRAVTFPAPLWFPIRPGDAITVAKCFF